MGHSLFTMRCFMFEFHVFSHESSRVITVSIATVNQLTWLCSASASTARPTSVSSRNWSGSGSCRSMEIWVRTVIVASINALLIYPGLQPSICIVHTHLHMHRHTCTNTHMPATRNPTTHKLSKRKK